MTANMGGKIWSPLSSAVTTLLPTMPGPQQAAPCALELRGAVLCIGAAVAAAFLSHPQ
jgi:hypothetical protein